VTRFHQTQTWYGSFAIILMDWFGKTRCNDPWWWPISSDRCVGRHFGDWGLEPGEEHAYLSLGRKSTLNGYPGFRGSIGAQPDCWWLISTRPSQSGIGPALGPLYPKLRDVLADGRGLARFHVTDMIKFRGQGPDQNKDEALTESMWQTSVRCLMQEYQTLKPRKPLLMTRECKRWFQTTIAPPGLRSHWRGNSATQDLDSFLETLDRESVGVFFWNSFKSAEEIVQDWRRKLGLAHN